MAEIAQNEPEATAAAIGGPDWQPPKIVMVEGLPPGMRLVRGDGSEVKVGDRIDLGERFALRSAEIEGPLVPPAEPERPAEGMSDAQIAEIEARANAATPGPWTVSRVHHDDRPGTNEVADLVNDAWIITGADLAPWPADAAFIARARSDIPALLAEVRRLRARNADLRALIDRAATEIEDMAEVGIPAIVSELREAAKVLR